MKVLVTILAVHAAVSVLTFAVYAWDKRAAARGGRRVRERTLHLLELLGGWPGGVVARRVLRHKTRDWAFLTVSWLIMLGHGAAWAAAGWRAWG